MFAKAKLQTCWMEWNRSWQQIWEVTCWSNMLKLDGAVYSDISSSLYWDDSNIMNELNGPAAMWVSRSTACVALNSFEQITLWLKWVQTCFNYSSRDYTEAVSFCSAVDAENGGAGGSGPGSPALGARETVESHLCLCAWLQASLWHTAPEGQ